MFLLELLNQYYSPRQKGLKDKCYWDAISVFNKKFDRYLTYIFLYDWIKQISG